MVRLSYWDRLLQIFVVTTLIIIALIAVIPVLSVISLSLSSRLPVELNIVTIWPRGVTLESWAQMLSQMDLWRSFLVTAAATLIGTTLCLAINVLTAYPLAKKEFRLGKLIMLLVVITMIFKAPLIPYFLTVKAVGLYNSPWVLVVPQLLNSFNLIIVVTFFRQFPQELEEAAVMEGSGYFRLLFTLVLPLSKAVLATVGLFYAVVIWNQYLHPLLFISDPRWFPLQIKVRQLTSAQDQLPQIGQSAYTNFNATTLQAVVIIFALIPIFLVYPYLQKYFSKGAMLGAVKG